MELLLNASVEELRRGYTQNEYSYICILCGERIDKGVVYPDGGKYYEAERYMVLHIEKEHGSVFEFLINLDNKYTGLSEHQSRLMKYFYQDKSDNQIQKEMGLGSSSTVRNHRFILKEKERQAKMFLVLMEMINKKNKSFAAKGLKHKSEKPDLMADEKSIRKYFPEGTEGKLKTFDIKEKHRLAVMKEVVKKFNKDRSYVEKEVNEILKTVYHDFATLRRYLIDYGFMERVDDGSMYWINDNTRKDVKPVDHKKELKQQYKEMKTEAGVYQIRNTQNDKIFVISTPNLKTMNGRHIELQSGNHRNKQLQQDWNKYGENAFVFEVLEVLEEKEDGFFDAADELKKLEKKWLEKLQPYGEKGYNTIKK